MNMQITDLDKLVDWTFKEIRESINLDPVSTIEQIRYEVLSSAFRLCATTNLYDVNEYVRRVLIRDRALYYVIVNCIDDYPQFEHARDGVVKLAVLL